MTDTTNTDAANTARKPRVISLIALTAIFGIVAFLLARANLADLNLYQSLGTAVPAEVSLMAYGSVVAIALSVIAVVLIARYQRLGLILAAVIFAAGLIVYIRFALVASINVVWAIIIILGVLGLAYSLMYLLRAPNKTFFR